MLRWTKVLILIFTVMLQAGFSKQAEALVVINEFLADPATDMSGDANNDGVRSGSDDEFVELLNYSAGSVDVSGWYLSDSTSTRHVFPSNTLLDAFSYLLVFGGGNPNLPGVVWQEASTGTLSLNNTSDTIKLYDATNTLIYQVPYGSLANNDQSLVLFPEGVGSVYQLHAEVTGAQGKLFSPGQSVTGSLLAVNAVPEPASLLTFLIGSISAAILRKRS